MNERQVKCITAFRNFFRRPFFSAPLTLFGLWMSLALIAALVKTNRCNNFLIFKYVFWHTWEGTSLYAPYPDFYFDTNHYGPFFSLVVAPFAVLPHPLGLIFWDLLMVLALYVAVRKLPMAQCKQIFCFWFCAHELLTALFMSQFNIVIAAIIVASFYCIEKEKDFMAACFIMIGTFVKLYGIVGLAFFFFSKHKGKFVLSLLFWAVVCFVLPMAISSPEYIIGQYREWNDSLAGKNLENMFSNMQNQSLLGLVRKISHVSTYSDLWIIVPGILAFCYPYLRIRQYGNIAFRYAFLASTLMFVVLFSTGSESSTYIIALLGVAIWYVTAPWQRSRFDIALMVFAFVLTSMSPSDLFPSFLRKNYVQPYALKALPCVLVWFKLIYEMSVKDYSDLKTEFDHCKMVSEEING